MDGGAYLESSPLMTAEESSRTRASSTAFVAGIIATLLLLVTTILAWILWSHGRSSTDLWHAILSTLALLLAAFGTYWAFSARRGISSGITPSALLSIVVFIGSLLFGLYHLVSALFNWINKCNHASALYPQQASPQAWSAQFGSKTVEGVAASDASMYFWMSVLSVVIAACFALLAYAAFIYMTNQLQTSKIAMMIALTGVLIFGFLALIWTVRNKDIYLMLTQYFSSLPNMMWLLVIVLSVILALAIVNAILNIFRMESAYFIMGCVWVLLGFVLLFVLGLLLRDLYKSSCGRNISCKMAADLTPATEYADFCPQGKYLPAGQTCRKIDLTVNWEADSSPVFLNPACCGAATSIVLWPFFLIALFGLLTLAFMGIAAGANFAQTDHDPAYDEYASQWNIVDLITLGIAALLAIGFLLYLFFGVKSAANTRYAKSAPPGFVVNPDGSLTPLPSFAPVPIAANATAAATAPLCYPLEQKLATTFAQGACGGAAVCGMSVGLLATNAQFRLDGYAGQASFGPKSSRAYFFPEDLNARNDFVNLYGTADQINQSLKGLTVCQNNLIDPHGVYAKALSADVGNLNNYSLTGGAAFNSTEPSPSGASGNYNGLPVQDVCSGSCAVKLVAPAEGNINIRGRLLVKNATGQLVTYGVPEAGVELRYGQFEGGQFKSLGFGSYDADGNFLINAPYSAQSNYVGTIQVLDPTKQYLENTVDVMVGTPPKDKTDLFIGDLILTTASGRGCKSPVLTDTISCFAGQTPTNYDLTLKAVDMVSGRPVGTPMSYTIRRGYSASGPVIAGPGSLSAGALTASLPAGYYTVELEGAGYDRRSEPILLDQNRAGEISLPPRQDDVFNIYMDIDNSKDPAYDYDLGLKMRTADGKECVVSSQNPVCPFAQKVNDIGASQRGYEVIQVSKFVNATYMAFVSKGPAYGTCAQAAAARALAQSPRHLLFGYFASNPLYNLFTSYLGGNWGGTAYSSGLGAGLLNMGSSLFQNSLFGGSGLTGGAGSTWGGLASNIFGSTGSFADTAFAYLPQTWTSRLNMGLPIKMGGFTNAPNLFTSLKNLIVSQPGAYQLPDPYYYFNLLAGNSNSANLFLQAMPILYSNQGGYIQNFVSTLANSGSLSPLVAPGFNDGAKALQASRFAFNDGSATTLLGKLMEYEVISQNNRIRQDNSLGPNSYFYDQMFKNQLAPANGSALLPGAGGLNYVPGIGEEPYSYLRPNNTDNLEFNDLELALEDKPVPITPLIANNGSVVFDVSDLVGVEVNGQASVYIGNGTSPAAYAPAGDFFDLSAQVSANATAPYPVANFTTKYVTSILPTSQPGVATYLRDELGLVSVLFNNGTYLYTDLVNRTHLTALARTFTGSDNTSYLEYADGTSVAIFANGTSLMRGPNSSFTKVMFPLSSNTTIVTSYVTQTAPAALLSANQTVLVGNQTVVITNGSQISAVPVTVVPGQTTTTTTTTAGDSTLITQPASSSTTTTTLITQPASSSTTTTTTTTTAAQPAGSGGITDILQSSAATAPAQSSQSTTVLTTQPADQATQITVTQPAGTATVVSAADQPATITTIQSAQPASSTTTTVVTSDAAAQPAASTTTFTSGAGAQPASSTTTTVVTSDAAAPVSGGFSDMLINSGAAGSTTTTTASTPAALVVQGSGAPATTTYITTGDAAANGASTTTITTTSPAVATTGEASTVITTGSPAITTAGGSTVITTTSPAFTAADGSTIITTSPAVAADGTTIITTGTPSVTTTGSTTLGDAAAAAASNAAAAGSTAIGDAAAAASDAAATGSSWWNKVTSLPGKLVNAVTGTASSAANAASNAASSATNAVSNAVDSAASAVANTASNAVGSVSNTAANIADAAGAQVTYTDPNILGRRLQETDTLPLDPAIAVNGTDAAPVVTTAAPTAAAPALPVNATVTDPTPQQVPVIAAPNPAPQFDSFVVHFCFTGFGPKSIRPLSLVSAAEVSIAECEKLYPENDPYSLARLSRLQ